MKIITTAIAALFIAGPAIAAQPQRTVVTVMQGAVLCPNHGDLVVFSTSAQLMPGCGRIAHDTPAVQVYPPEQGIVGVRSDDGKTWWALEASIRR
jgi:hypothetical protein